MIHLNHIEGGGYILQMRRNGVVRLAMLYVRYMHVSPTDHPSVPKLVVV